MAETVGSLIDKITIADLKIYHMREQTLRSDAAPEHVENCRRKLEILNLQKNDLADELAQLVKNIFSGKYRPKTYRQFKMYNDPEYRIKET